VTPITSGNGAKRGSNILLLLFADLTIVVVPYTSAPGRIARAIRCRHSQKSALRLRGEPADRVWESHQAAVEVAHVLPED
jgi:hypothetical protein